ncbi:hypothetical protein AB1Y20_010918 [Prymnesium parvum]|uniref:NusB/RsmB/TIM44 domain-containing protein n=1 Tax=Prymnesium parvum TaxID=97485 RepID=A0AB34IQ45_PRYPA
MAALLCLAAAPAAAAPPRAPPPAILRIARATRELSCTFLYAGLVRAAPPLSLFDDEAHADFFASPSLALRLHEAAKERAWPAALPATRRLAEPPGAVPVGEARSAEDRRGGASLAMCRQQLRAVAARRDELEEAIVHLLDPKVAPHFPAFDYAILLLFMSELHEGMQLPVACSEAVDLSLAYSGMDETYRYVNGVLAAYAREYKVKAG